MRLQYPILIKRWPITFLLFYIILLIRPVETITIPEGIRGFTVTYGTWIESVLSKSPFRDLLFPEDQEQYDKLQRLIITSERLSEEGNARDALSYLRRADFYMQDLEKSLARKYGWTKTSYAADEMKGWTENVREAWNMQLLFRMNIFLQYEYFSVLNNNPNTEYYTYVQEALKLFYSLDKETQTYKKIQISALPLYITNIESSWNSALQNKSDFSISSMMEFIAAHTSDFISGSGYWKRKYLKRSIILLSRFGYPEKSWYLMNHLMEDKSDTLPVKVNFNLMIYNSRYEEAENYILDNINILNLTELDNWGIYINYNKNYLNLLLLRENYETYDINAEKFISRLQSFLQRIDLTTEIYEYVGYELNEAILNKAIVSYYQNPSSTVAFKNLNMPTGEFTADEIRLKKKILESYINNETGFAAANIYSAYRIFQSHINRQDPAKSMQSLEILKKEYPDQFLTNLGILQYSLLADSKSLMKKDWYDLWMSVIQGFIEQPQRLLFLNSGLYIDFNCEKALLEFLDRKKDLFEATELAALLNTVSILTVWDNKMLYPPEYFNPADYIYRYAFLDRWGFGLTESAGIDTKRQTSLYSQIETDNTCAAENPCWFLYPSNDTLYSIIIKNSRTVSIVKSGGLHQSLELTQSMFHKLNKSGKNKESSENLQVLSENFSELSDQLETIVRTNGNKITLFSFKYANLFPFEALYFKDMITHIGDRFRITRKLPLDQTYVLSCTNLPCTQYVTPLPPGKNEAVENTFIGVGNTNPGFIIANPNLDEILDIEGLFSKKKLFSDSVNLSTELMQAIEKTAGYILHVAGEWSIRNNTPRLVIENPANGIELRNFRYIPQIPYLILSKNRSSNFDSTSYATWEKILTTFRYKNTKIILTSMALSPKEFRQAFFYDFYYKIEHKNSGWNDAFFSAMDRTKKGFPDSIWPYLMVIYEQ